MAFRLRPHRMFINITLAVFSLAAVLSGCAAEYPSPTAIIPDTALPLSVDEGVLTVAIDANWPPFQFVDETGSATGFDVELAKEIASRLGLEIRVLPDTWSAAQVMVREGTADCVFSLTPTDDRAKVYDFSQPYRQDITTIFVKSDSPVYVIEDLHGKTVAVEGGGTNLMNQLLGSHFDQLRIYVTNSPEESLVALQSDQSDAAFIGAAEVGYYIARNLNLEMRPVFEAQGVNETIAVKKGNVALLAKINGVLDEIKADGTLDLIYGRWFDGH